MLPKNRRINKELFLPFVKKSRIINGSLVSLRFAKQTKSDSITLLAVVISNKAVKLSVNRHLIKRRCHNFLQKLLPKIKNGYYLAFFINKNIKNISFDELEQEIIKLLVTSGILTE